MSDAWQLAESFERTRQLIAAINVISVHSKLLVAGIVDPQLPTEVQHAKDLLRGFLEKLSGDITHIDRDASSPMTGETVRSGMLTKRFATARNQAPGSSPIFSIPLQEFVPLLQSENPSDLTTLIAGLKTLRNLLEQHHHADSSEMLGNL